MNSKSLGAIAYFINSLLYNISVLIKHLPKSNIDGYDIKIINSPSSSYSAPYIPADLSR